MDAVIAAAVLALFMDGPIVPTLGVVLALRYPLLAGVGIAGWILHSNLGSAGVGPAEEARFLRAVATELRAGASPRAALYRAAVRHPAIDTAGLQRAVRLGLGADRVADELRAALPHNGRLAAAAFAAGGRAGAPMSGVLTVLAQRTAARSALERERRAASAQARATAWLISGIPLTLIVFMAVTGRLGSSAALPLVAAGVGLQVLGIAAVVFMLRGRE